jgi:DNA-binding transcriptional ArsR family regulator
MKPLYHPPLSEITVQGLLYALSDPLRVRIYRDLARAECAQNCRQFSKIDGTAVPKASLSQHFKILREAGLIRSERKGVELKNYTRCPELKRKFGPMLKAIMKAYEEEGR